MGLTVEEIIKATGGKLLYNFQGEPKSPSEFKGVSIDSRTIPEGEIFFALRGERFDGHDFLNDALSKGNGAVINSNPQTLPRGKIIIYVEDTLKALQDVAHYLRVSHNVPVIAVTGSNGKTTTKEMIYTILSRRFNVLKNEGNLNNHIGVPLSLTKLAPEHEVIVLEFGMNAIGEIRRLCEIAVPTHGVVTNIGSAHLGELGGLDSVRNAKLEILEDLNVVILNADDTFLMEGVKDFKGKMITFSIDNDSDVKANEVFITENGSRFMLDFKGNGHVAVTLNIPGAFNIYNALAASAACYSLGITLDEIKTSLESYRGLPMRFEVMKEKGITVINDTYNANPSSMHEAMIELTRIKGKGRLVIVLGDMLEMGTFSEEAHRSIGRMAADIGVNVFIAVGRMMKLAAEESRNFKSDSEISIYTFTDAEEVKQNISGILRHGDTVLVKGSRAMCMEKVVEGITNVI